MAFIANPPDQSYRAEPRQGRGVISLILFLVLVIAGGSALGLLSQPGEWYRQLDKPSFNPPSWVFAPVWTTLYVMIAIAGWRTWRRDRAGMSMKIWWAQLALNFAWTPVFFTLHQLEVALGVVLALLALIVAFSVTRWRSDRTAAWLFVPYAMWVSFASTLNGFLAALN